MAASYCEIRPIQPSNCLTNVKIVPRFFIFPRLFIFLKDEAAFTEAASIPAKVGDRCLSSNYGFSRFDAYGVKFRIFAPFHYFPIISKVKPIIR